MTRSQIATGLAAVPNKALLVFAGTILIALGAKIQVPFWPSPITLQTLAITLIALSLGPRLAVLTVVAYLAEGFAFIPVFAGTTAGPAYFAGPTGGFLLGFVVLAGVAGLGARRGLFSMVLFSILGGVLLYLPGLAWPMWIAELAGIDANWVGSDVSTIWQYWVSPFILGDLTKAVLASMLVWQGVLLWAKR